MFIFAARLDSNIGKSRLFFVDRGKTRWRQNTLVKGRAMRFAGAVEHKNIGETMQYKGGFTCRSSPASDSTRVHSRCVRRRKEINTIISKRRRRLRRRRRWRSEGRAAREGSCDGARLFGVGRLTRAAVAFYPYRRRRRRRRRGWVFVASVAPIGRGRTAAALKTREIRSRPRARGGVQYTVL